MFWRFSRDPKRRKQWLAKMRIHKWVPTDNSYLCEVHFAPEMWEKTREVGSRKLKSNAIPTIFWFTKRKATRKPPPRRKILASKKVRLLSPRLSPTSATLDPVDIPRQEINTTEPSAISTPADVQDSSSPISSSSASHSVTSGVGISQIPEGVQNAEELLRKLSKYEKLFYRERARARKFKNLSRSLKKLLKNINPR